MEAIEAIATPGPRKLTVDMDEILKEFERPVRLDFILGGMAPQPLLNRFDFGDEPLVERIVGGVIRFSFREYRLETSEEWHARSRIGAGDIAYIDIDILDPGPCEGLSATFTVLANSGLAMALKHAVPGAKFRVTRHEDRLTPYGSEHYHAIEALDPNWPNNV